MLSYDEQFLFLFYFTYLADDTGLQLPRRDDAGDAVVYLRCQLTENFLPGMLKVPE